MSQEDLSAYFDVPQDCLVCGGSNKQPWGKRDIYSAVRCGECGFVWVDPILTEEGLNRYYANYIKHRLEDKKKMQQRSVQYAMDRDFLLQYCQGGCILDVGCNGGFFLNTFDDRFEKYGIEVDGEAVAFAQANFPFGKNIKQAWIGKEGFKSGFFDAIMMRGVIEHLRDPKAAVARVAQLLKPGGFFFISATPNAESFCAELYRGQWNQFTPPQHLYFFSIRTLSRLAEPFGLSLLGKDFPYLETPYANVKEDHAKVLRDYEAVTVKQQAREELEVSPAFWGNMMTAVWQKQG